MIDNMYLYGHNCSLKKSEFLEIFQKPLGGLFIAARQHISVCLFMGSSRGTAWRYTPNRQVTRVGKPSFLGSG